MRKSSRLLAAAVTMVALGTATTACGSSSDGGAATSSTVSESGVNHSVIIARHGESWTNIAAQPAGAVDPATANMPVPVSNPADFLGPTGDLPLSEAGAKQADAMAASLADEVDDIYASAQVRTFQTARAVSIANGEAVHATWDLREIGTDRSLEPQWLKGGALDTPVGPENDRRSFNESKATFMNFWNQFIDDHKGEEGTSLIVTHGGVMRLFVAPLCANPKLTSDFIAAHPIGNTQQIKATLHPDGSVTCTEWVGEDITP
jgi:broad specificity phosphatase PhoE